MNQFTKTALSASALSAALTLIACNSNQPSSAKIVEAEARGRSPEQTQQIPTVNRANQTSMAQDAVISTSIVESLTQQGKQLTASESPIAFEAASFMPEPRHWPRTEASTERYAKLESNRTIQTLTEPVSTFSIDVDTGAYSNVRRFLQNGQLPPGDAVRAEELLNYFSYDYETTASTQTPFSVVTELGPTPWNSHTRLLHIGLKGYLPPASTSKDANLVFLVDVSGSMNSPDKLGLLKSSISLLAHEMDEDDTISIVVYAGSSGVVLEPTAGNQHRAIDRALSALTAGGSTNGQQGIELAYQLATDNYKLDGVNRVILATDGDFNVGISDVEALKQLIRKKRESGIALTTLGFGTGNYNDHLMEQLADVGNGSYAYIDTLGEARKVLVDERDATLLTIAKDVKIQVEFNPATVSEYRLIGYSNRQLANEDFSNDKVDAGEIGAGHTVTALYEVALPGEGGERHSPRRYAPADKTSPHTGSQTRLLDELAEVRLRYKLPDSESSQLISHVVGLTEERQPLARSSDNFRFSASVAAFAQLLRDRQQLNDFSYEQTRELALSAVGEDRFGYRAEYLRLVDMARGLDQMERAANAPHDATEG